MNKDGTISNVGQAIQGRAAGVEVQQADFSPGAGMNIVVRGGNSINTSNQPLFVIDGFISQAELTEMRNRIIDGLALSGYELR